MKIFSFIILLSLIFACSKLALKDDELSLARENYLGNQLQIDGYFYFKEGDKYFGLYCLYRNGVILSMGGSFLSHAEMDAYVQQEFITNKNYTNYKLNWGVFQINGNTIKFERWYPAFPKPAYIREGVIINDTTFTITQSYRMKKGEKTEIDTEDETYYFKKFSPKPDSVNSFIE